MGGSDEFHSAGPPPVGARELPRTWMAPVPLSATTGGVWAKS
ncbi:hypothetical protein ACIBVL_37350 [Streptomyces sp. NPDC049687]